MKEIILTCSKVYKNFGNQPALKAVDLTVHEGEIFGLLGHNGAGKTTLIRCVTGLLRFSSGSILFRGKPLTDELIRKSLGFLPESFLPPPNLTAEEFLGFLAKGLGLGRNAVKIRLEQVGLWEQRAKTCRRYSRGMTQRLGLAAALLKDPPLVILDEPTLGLDPIGQKQMLDLLQGLNTKGTTIFFSSHTLSQVEKLCHRIGIIKQGELRFSGTVAGFVSGRSAASLEEAFLKEMA